MLNRRSPDSKYERYAIVSIWVASWSGVKDLKAWRVCQGMGMRDPQRTLGEFESFAATTGERVRRALVAHYGVEVGAEASAEAMAVAWQRWDSVAEMENPAGFLFRVGQSKARPHLRWRRRNTGFPAWDLGSVSDDAAVLDLLRSMARLPEARRACVLLVKSYGFSYREVGRLLGISETAVTNHVHRGMSQLRSMMEVRA